MSDYQEKQCHIIKDEEGYVSLCVNGSILKVCIGKVTDGYMRFNELVTNVSFPAAALRNIAKIIEEGGAE